MAPKIEVSKVRTFELPDSEATDRTQETAGQGLLRMLTGPSRWIGPGPEPSDEELMEAIVSGIKEDRRGGGQGTNVSLPSSLDTPRETP